MSLWDTSTQVEFAFSSLREIANVQPILIDFAIKIRAQCLPKLVTAQTFHIVYNHKQKCQEKTFPQHYAAMTKFQWHSRDSSCPKSSMLAIFFHVLMSPKWTLLWNKQFLSQTGGGRSNNINLDLRLLIQQYLQYKYVLSLLNYCKSKLALVPISCWSPWATVPASPTWRKMFCLINALVAGLSVDALKCYQWDIWR